MRFIFSVARIAGLMLAALLCATSVQAEAPTPISGEQIIRQLTAFLADRKITSTPALDRNRQFRACGQPLAFTPLFGSFKTVEVRCPDVDGWKIAVRTQIETSLVAHKINRPQVTAKQINRPQVTAKPSLPVQNVVVMRKSVSKGTIITSEDVKIDQMKPGTAGDYFASVKDVVGRIAKRRLNIGKAVMSSQLEHDWLVRKGQSVKLFAEIGAVSVQSAGIALEDAQWGQMARFLNVSSNKEVFGRVKSEKKIIIRANIN
jgi:flagellar basal body P-ring formation protein FlgA